MSRGGRRPGAGRPAGSRNRAGVVLPGGRSLGELCRESTGEAVEAPRSVMGSDQAPASARVSAACALLDRGWGRPPQHVEVDVDPPGGDGEETLRLVRPGDPGFVEPPTP